MTPQGAASVALAAEVVAGNEHGVQEVLAGQRLLRC